MLYAWVENQSKKHWFHLFHLPHRLSRKRGKCEPQTRARTSMKESLGCARTFLTATRDLCHNSEEKFRRRRRRNGRFGHFEVGGKYLRSWAKSCITKTRGESSKQLSCVYTHRWEERWSPAWSWDQTQRPRGDFFYISATGGNQMPFSWGILDLGENAVVHGWINVCCKCFKRSVGVLRILISSLQPSTFILLY